MNPVLNREAAADPWFGNDLKSWTQTIRSGYARAFILFALHETGVFQALKNGEKKSCAVLAAERGLDPHLLEGVLEFLVFSDVILEKANGGYYLTEKGLEYVFSGPVITLSWGAVGGYSCILTELVPSLRGEKKYGVDYKRRGDYVAISSEATGGGAHPWVVSEFSRLGVKTVLDLGCGSADVLISFCRLDPGLRGVGVDIDPRALEEAGRRVRAAGFSEKIKLISGDITRPKSFAQETGPIEAVNGIMVFHEFLRDGEDAVIGIFKDLKARFPGAYFFLGEVDTYSEDEIRSLPRPERLHFLFYQYLIHTLTWQGMPMPKENWLNLFERAGIDVVMVKEDLPSLLRIVEIVGHF